MLYPMRNEWRMMFVTSGREALDLLSATEYDVLVTDLRMPEMSGAELLSRVVESYPQIVRLVLSATADQETMGPSTALAHQYIVKPCDAAALRATVERAFSLRAMLVDPRLRHLISSIHNLPSVPAVYARLAEALQAPETSLQDVGRLISQDMSMTAKVLQLVNSAYFSISRQITDPAEAVIYLGTETVRELVLVVSAFSAFKLKSVRHFSIEALQDHSLKVGIVARAIAGSMHLPKVAIEQAYVGGLLHAVGKLVLASQYGERYDRAIKRVKDEGVPERMAEVDAFGTTHAEVGAYLLWLWAVPAPITEIVLRHHEFPVDSAEAHTPKAAVYLADGLVNGGEEHERCSEYVKFLGLDGELEEWEQLYQG